MRVTVKCSPLRSVTAVKIDTLSILCCCSGLRAPIVIAHCNQSCDYIIRNVESCVNSDNIYGAHENPPFQYCNT